MNEHSDPLERRLRRDLSAVDAAPVPESGAVVAAARRSAHRRQVRARVLVGGVSVLAVIAAGAALATRSPDDGATTAPSLGASVPDGVDLTTTTPAPDQTSGPPTTTVPSSAWAVLPADPRGVRRDAAAVWTGSEVLVFGGSDAQGQFHRDAAAYDEFDGTWRQLEGPPEALRNVLAAWAGDRALLLGGVDADGNAAVGYATAYSPAADTWSAIALPSTGLIDDRSPWVWTGTELLVWPAQVEAGAGADPVPTVPIAYDPALDQWRALPQPPLMSRQQAASVWTGGEWIIWGGRGADGELADGAAYSPATDTWRVLAASPLSARRVRAVWTGTEMLVYGGSQGGDPVTGDGEFALADGAAYDLATDTWHGIASGPAHPGFQPVWTGSLMVMFAKGCAVAYDPAADQWSEGECGGEGIPLWTGTQVLVVGEQLTAFSPA